MTRTTARRAPQTRSVPKQEPDSGLLRASVVSTDPSNARIDVQGPLRAQTIVLDDFPDPVLARTLSPNGRAHWAAKLRAQTTIRERLWFATRDRPLVPVRAPARITYRWVVPDRRRRDQDNHSTGVVKVVQDWLVEREHLPDGDHSAVLEIRVEIVHERRQRRLEIVLEAGQR